RCHGLQNTSIHFRNYLLPSHFQEEPGSSHFLGHRRKSSRWNPKKGLVIRSTMSRTWKIPSNIHLLYCCFHSTFHACFSWFWGSFLTFFGPSLNHFCFFLSSVAWG